jgi:ribosomal protein S14
VDMSAVKSAKEWICPHCRSVNVRKARECEKCGAPRPFIYD